MMVCPQCARSIESHETYRPVAVCPFCGATLVPQSESDWVDVARVSNLAEAGFLSDDLQAQGIETRVIESDRFNALAGSWTSAYVLQAPTTSARDAAERVARHMADDRRPTRIDSRDESSVVWRPVALMVLAGVASFALGQYLAEDKPGDRPAPPTALSAAVDAIDRPFVTQAPAGQPRYRLMFDRRQQAWYLDTDDDGDGFYERHQRYHATGHNW